MRAVLVAAVLAGMALGTPAHAQIGFRNAASSSAIGPQFRDAASATSSNSITFAGAGAQVARESAGDLTPALPGAAQANDFAVLIIAGRPTDTAEPAAPSGWTLRSSSLREVGANDLKIMTFYRVLAGGDANPSIALPASWQGSSAGMSAQIAVWRGVNTTTPFDVADVTGNFDSDNRWTPPSITTVTNGALVVSAVATSDDNRLDIDSTQGFSARMEGGNYDTTTGGDHAIGVADKTQATAGAVTMLRWEQTDNEDDRWAGITFALRPGTTLTIGVPNGTAQNDVMIASVGFQPSTATISPPAGWTLVRRVDNGSATANSLEVYRKLAGASEPASFSWSSSGVTFLVGGIQSFSGIDTTANPIDVESSGQATASATTHATESVTTSVANAMIVTSHTYASSQAWTQPTGMNEAFDRPSGAGSPAGQSILGSYAVQLAAEATGARTATAAGDADSGIAHILALRPASSGLTINKPPLTVASDVMVASIGVQPSTTVITPPAGWDLVRRIDNTSGNSNSLEIYIKEDGGAEPASYTWGLGGFAHAVGGIQSFSGVDTANPWDVEGGQSTSSGTSHATPSVNRTINGAMLVTSHSFAASGVWSPPSGMNESFDVASLTPSNTSGQSMEGNWLTEYAMGATGTKTATVGGSNFGNTHILALRPASPPALPGGFNAYETSTGAGAITGVIRTKIAGNTVSLDIIALNADKTAIYTAFADTVGVEVLNTSDNSGALDGSNCRSTWTVIQTLSPLTLVPGDNGRETISFNQTNSYPDVRLRVAYPAGAPTRTGCSTDNFAIRPDQFDNLRVRDSNWETAGTSRTLNDTSVNDTTLHKAGRPFTVTATAENDDGNTTTNYTGTPAAVLSDCGGDSACFPTFGTFTLGEGFVAGQLSSNLATYSDVGSFELRLVDSAFASVDAADSTASEREIRSDRIDVGRFVPDHFAVAFNAPAFGTACGSFTYIGQAFNYSTAPVITVTAQNFSNGTTANYAGVLWRITNTSLSPTSQAARYSAATGTLDLALLPAVGADPVIAANGNGTGTLTFSSGSGIAFSRSSAVAPFDAELSLAISIIDRDDVTHASNPARFGQATAGNGVAFSSGKSMRFGRLRLENATGSEKLDLPIPIQTQYWTGTHFQTNSADNCTSISAANVAFSSYFGGITSTNMNAANISGLGVPFSAGFGSLTLTKPSPAPSSFGAVTVTVNLTAEAKSYLKGNWGVPTFTADPRSRAAFGLYGGQPNNFIYFRENF